MLLTRLVVLGVYFSLCIEMACPLPKKRKDDGVFKCVFNQMCNCGTAENQWEECWEYLAEATVIWITNRTHQCEKGGNYPYGEFKKLRAHMCSLPEDDYKVCYNEVSEAFKGYLNKVNMDTSPEKKKEGNLIQKAQTCGAVNLMKCAQFGVC